MFKKLVLLLSLLLAFVLWNCDPQDPVEENPLPTLNLISPTTKVDHMPTFTLTATGANFVPDSTIVFDGTARVTNFVSASELTCQITPDDILLAAGAASGGPGATVSQTVTVLVRTPTPGGGDSGAQQFAITDNHTFDSILNISANARDSNEPCISVDGEGGVNVAWENRISQNNYEIFFKRSGDRGTTWGQTGNISNSTRKCFNPEMALDNSGNINVVWNDSYVPMTATGALAVYLGQSTDNGGNWDVKDIENILQEEGTPAYSKPDIAIDGSGVINLVWQDYKANGSQEITFLCSTDNGVTWEPAVNVSDSITGSCIFPDIAIGDTDIHIVWTKQPWGGGYNINLSSSADNGAAWSQPLSLSTARYYARPVIEAGNAGNIFVFLADDTQGWSDIYFCKSTDNGSSWSTAVNISNTQGDSIYPSAAIDSAGNINLLWSDDTSGNAEIYFTRSIDNGMTWSAASNISASTGDSLLSAIALDQEGNIYIVWEDETPGNYDIYFTRSTI